MPFQRPILDPTENSLIVVHTGQEICSHAPFLCHHRLIHMSFYSLITDPMLKLYRPVLRLLQLGVAGRVHACMCVCVSTCVHVFVCASAGEHACDILLFGSC